MVNIKTKIYSETLPYGHLASTVTSLLRPLFFGRLAKPPYFFLCKNPNISMAKFFLSIGERINAVPLQLQYLK